jgi:hypothetical protein
VLPRKVAVGSAGGAFVLDLLPWGLAVRTAAAPRTACHCLPRVVKQRLRRPVQHQLDVPGRAALTQSTYGVFCTSAAAPLPNLLSPLTPSATVMCPSCPPLAPPIPFTQTAATLQSVNPAAPEELTFRDPVIDQEDPAHLLTDADMAAADAAGKAKHGVSGVQGLAGMGGKGSMLMGVADSWWSGLWAGGVWLCVLHNSCWLLLWCSPGVVQSQTWRPTGPCLLVSNFGAGTTCAVSCCHPWRQPRVLRGGTRARQN